MLQKKVVTTKALERRFEKVLGEFEGRLSPKEIGELFHIICPELYDGDTINPPPPKKPANSKRKFEIKKKVYFLNFGDELPDD